MRNHAYLFEANARILLRRVSEKYCQPLTLSSIPDEEWQLLRHKGFDLIWLMGVWKRSPGARQKALSDPALCREYNQALPGWSVEDIDGSPYAVYAYNLDPALGSQQGELFQLRSILHRHGLGLILDFVPNHLAFDHPWTFSNPGWFVQGIDEDALAHPDWFFSPVSNIHLAHGRDPNFPPWSDTVQVNFYSKDLRHALIKELLRIAEVADGVRCDMAMLALNSVFQRVWEEVIKNYHQPEEEFWVEAIGQVKRQWPDFLFLAEAYWGFERELQKLGFDFIYDKVLYDRLRFSTPGDIRSHLIADKLYQQCSVHFVENHDEPRAITAFSLERSLAAAVILATIPGLRLFQDGQLEGKRIHLPVQLVREPKEAEDLEIMRFYDRLLEICNTPAFHEGEWKLIEASQGWDGNKTHHNLLAWSWRYAEQYKIIVVNYSSDQAQGWLQLPLTPESPESLIFQDELTGEKHVRDANEFRRQGIYIDLGPWKAHILSQPLINNRNEISLHIDEY